MIILFEKNMSFIKKKALINILVHFRKSNSKTSDYISFIIDSIQKSINNLYGLNRFVVYGVNESDLRTNTRLLSAKALLIITNNNLGNESDLSTWIKTINLDKLILNYEDLLQSSNSMKNFNHDYFVEKILTLIPPSPIAETEIKSPTIIMDNSNEMFLLDSRNNIFHIWPRVCSLKLKEFPGCEQFRSDSPSTNDDIVYYLDNNRIDQLCRQQSTEIVNFNIQNYFDNLRTESIGRSLLFQNVTESTMKMANNVSKIDGIVAIANYQTTGLGRSDNQWLSPFGCAMFTINLHVPYTSGLLSKITLIQHIASLSVIMALPSDELNVKIKWPNDILFMPSGSKLCGILVRSFSFEYHLNVQIGIGMNVSNRLPSVCLDEVIEHYNDQQMDSNKKLKPISRESMIARILNCFERLYHMLTNGQVAEIQQLYCSNWIHSDDIVDIYDNNNNNDDGQQQQQQPQYKARIIGIDDNGYLLAQDLNNDMIHCLQPDGNRFDLMNRLLKQKR
ncbi:holocarboxylase synthetase-like protein [Dermatophagoides pteronyssinus]|uniref:holocarboxylase synthetase-like protein n=1 Tax=Dermatophagoides pteronyssinus TaxID=6956 RepID=UPI003F665D58